MKKCFIVILMLLAIVPGLAGCGKESAKEEKLKIAFICKDLNHYWFLQEKKGIQEQCDKYGIETVFYNSEYDDELCLEQVAEAAKTCDGIILCVTNQELGPEIGNICQEIPVVAIDDSLEYENGTSFPYVAMPLKEIGALGGRTLVDMALQACFPADEKTHILEIDVPSNSTFRFRLEGYEEALFQGLGLSKENVVVIDGKTGMYEDTLEKVRAYFAKNPPKEDEYWIVTGCNDDTALAGMKGLLEAGASQDSVIACGLGGYELSIEEFEAQNHNYITIMTQPDKEGQQAAEMIYQYLTTGKEMKDAILVGGVVVTCDNYLLYFESEK